MGCDSRGVEGSARGTGWRGYVPPFRGSNQLRDVENISSNRVHRERPISGRWEPKPVAFPISADVAVDIDGIKKTM